MTKRSALQERAKTRRDLGRRATPEREHLTRDALHGLPLVSERVEREPEERLGKRASTVAFEKRVECEELAGGFAGSEAVSDRFDVELAVNRHSLSTNGAHDRVRDRAHLTDAEDEILGTPEDAIGNHRDGAPVRGTESKLALELLDRGSVRDEVAAELHLAEEPTLFERDFRLEDTERDRRDRTERKLSARGSRAEPGIAEFARLDRGDRLVFERRELAMPDFQPKLVGVSERHRLGDFTRRPRVARFGRERSGQLACEDFALDSAVAVAGKLGCVAKLERAVEREDAFEHERTIFVDVEGHHPDRSPIHGDEITAWIERVETERAKRAKDAAHITVRDLIGCERERLVCDERRTMRKEQRESHRSRAEAGGAASGKTAPCPTFGAAAESMIATRGDSFVAKRVRAKNSPERARRALEPVAKMAIGREPTRRRDRFLKEEVERIHGSDPITLHREGTIGSMRARMDPTSIFVDRGEHRLHVLDWRGSGRAIVFVHGGSAHAHWWDFVAPRFAGTHRPVALDLRGHGDSSASTEEAYRLDDYAADLVHVIDSLGLEQPILVGHSLGSFVTLRLAGLRPRGFSALVMVDGRATFGTGSLRYLKLLRMFAPAAYDSLDEAVERFSLLPRETDARADILEHVARRSFRRDGDGRWVAKFDRATFSAHHPFDFRESLADLDFPVLFVRGEHSRVLSARAAAELAALAPHGSWVEIPGAHHHVLLDRPEELAAAIARFLAENGL